MSLVDFPAFRGYSSLPALLSPLSSLFLLSVSTAFLLLLSYISVVLASKVFSSVQDALFHPTSQNIESTIYAYTPIGRFSERVIVHVL